VSRSMVPMSGKSKYRHAAKSTTSSTEAAPTTSEGSTPLTLRHHDPPAAGAAPSRHPRTPSPRPRHPGQPRAVAPILLGGCRLHDRPFLLDGDGGHWRGWHAQLLHCGAAQRTEAGGEARRARPARSGPSASGVRG
jgi:hypothetical protein